MMTKPSFDLENQHTALVAGIDEAGCGPWAGPVVAGACIFINQQINAPLLSAIDDSKKLTPKKRDLIFEQLITLPNTCFSYGVGIVSVEEIDQLLLGAATRLAMQRAISSLSIYPDVALIDGIRKPTLFQKVITVVKGDQKSYSIAAASIIAKVTRDRLMQQLDKEYPAYGWKENAGYGTAYHQQALKTHGITRHHRKSFAPVAALLKTTEV